MKLKIVRERHSIWIIQSGSAPLEQELAPFGLDANLWRSPGASRKNPQLLDDSQLVMAQHHRQLVRIEPFAMELILR
jgi:hypothetical protein